MWKVPEGVRFSGTGGKNSCEFSVGAGNQGWPSAAEA